MREASLNFLQTLLETPSPSGFETKGQRVWLDYVSKFADEVETDSYGNCYAILNPKGTPKVLLGGHSDELGFMVNYISDAGFIYFKGIGGVDNTLIRGQRVTVHGRKGSVAGVTGLLAIHLQESDDRKKVPGIHEMYIDVGAGSKKEAEEWVQIGDAITYSVGFQFLGEGKKRIAARGCDNRIGTFAAAEGVRLASENRKQLKACVVAASTIQEENGLYGASMAGYRVKPDVALVVDVTHATDIPSCSKEKFGDVKLGKGPVISFGSANHPMVNERLEKVASKNKMALQREINPRCTGTDADAIFIQHGGIPTASIGLPNRYMHSPVEVIELSDLEAIGDLLGSFALDLKSDEMFQVRI
ncbi:MAG: M42 family metallopeptidase [Verrucomicrobiae bacterium]|nr:M42 family metallopeptidase [Verrucomicrobiae bacterium]